MCTLSLFKSDHSLIVTINRDESRQRHEAGIKEQKVSNTNIIFPIDGLSGGTWFGINDSGVVMALLNRYQALHVSNPITRGKIIPSCLSMGSYSTIFDHLNQQNFAEFNPFDLFLICLDGCHQFTWDGQQTAIKQIDESAFQFSSSGVDTAEILEKRQRCFNQILDDQQKTIWQPSEILEAIHLNQDPIDQSSSVLMDRPLVHSKSICQVQLTTKHNQLNYYPETSLNAWRNNNSSVARLPRQQHKLTLNPITQQ